MDFSGKKMLVLGAGISGIAVAGILQDKGATVTLSDTKPAENIKHDLTGLKEKGVALALGRQGPGEGHAGHGPGPGDGEARHDGQHRAHTGLPRASQHRRAVVRVALAVNVGVGIDQQLRLAGCMGRVLTN